MNNQGRNWYFGKRATNPAQCGVHRARWNPVDIFCCSEEKILDILCCDTQKNKREKLSNKWTWNVISREISQHTKKDFFKQITNLIIKVSEKSLIQFMYYYVKNITILKRFLKRSAARAHCSAIEALVASQPFDGKYKATVSHKGVGQP